MADLLSITKACAKHLIPEATLRALIARNKLRDPIGNDHEVYDDSRLAMLARKCAAGRAAVDSTEVRNG